MRQLIIIGSGPAGLTAGIYSARAQLHPLIFAGEKSGGQLIDTLTVENWPGADEGILGPELMQKMRRQAEKFGAEIIDKNVTRVDFSQPQFSVNEETAKAVIIATGAKAVFLNIPGEKEFLGKGVATCAVCDGPFYKDKVVAVVGGGDSAAEAVLALTKFSQQIYLIVRRDQLRASKVMAERVKKSPQVKILWQTQVKAILGKDKVEQVKLDNGQELKLDGLFLAIGHQPATELFKNQVELNENGYIKTVVQSMTSVEGVFAAGDCVDGRYRQAITAAAMGCQAALDVEKWLESQEEK